MRQLLIIITMAALWWPAAAAAHPRAHLAMNQARAAIARFNGPTAMTGRCWSVRWNVVACVFSEPYEGSVFQYYAIARLRAGRVSVEWPGWN